MKSRGFTLIELMVVVGIIGIMATLSIGYSGDFRRRSTFHEVVREIYNGMNRARSEAIRRGLTTTVEITADRLTAFIDTSGDEMYQGAETMIYQYPEDPEVWPSGLNIDTTVLSTPNVKPVIIFDYQGFSITTAGDPLGGILTVTDPTTGLTRSIHLTLAGAVLIE